MYIFPAMMLRSLLSGNAPCIQKLSEKESVESSLIRPDDSTVSVTYRQKCRDVKDSKSAADDDTKPAIETDSLGEKKINSGFKTRKPSTLNGKDEATQHRHVVLGLIAVGLGSISTGVVATYLKEVGVLDSGHCAFAS